MKKQILITTLAGLFVTTLAWAWSVPTETAPSGNVYAPLNTGPGAQLKLGGLLIHTGAVTAGQPNGLIVLNGNVGIGDSTPDSKLDIESGDVRISTAGSGLIFSDGTKQTTAAIAGGGENLSTTLGFGNSAGTSDINMNGSDIVGVDRLVANTGDYAEIKSSSASYGLIVRDYDSNDWIDVDANAMEIRNSAGNFNINSAVDIYLIPSGGKTYATDFRANTFYDRDNPSYYVNPADSSRLNSIYATSFFYDSDRSLKENIYPISNSLEKILKLEGVNFNWKDTGNKSMGLISQDVEKIFPEIVSESDQGIKSIEYAKLVAPLIEAIKEQQRQIEELKSEINRLK